MGRIHTNMANTRTVIFERNTFLAERNANLEAECLRQVKYQDEIVQV